MTDTIDASTAWRQSETVRTLEDATKRLRQIEVPRPDADTDAIETVAYQALLDGDDPLDQLKPLAAVEQRFAAFERSRDVLRRFVSRLRDDLAVARASNTDPALTWLHDRLTEHVLAPLPDIVERLGGRTDATAAIRGGAATAAAWAQLVEIAQIYRQIRNAQVIITSHREQHHGLERYMGAADLVAKHGIVRDGPFIETSSTDGGVLATSRPDYIAVPNWPTEPIEFLLWAADNPDIEAWVPSVSELINAVTEHGHREYARRITESPQPDRVFSERQVAREIEQRRGSAVTRAGL